MKGLRTLALVVLVALMVGLSALPVSAQGYSFISNVIGPPTTINPGTLYTIASTVQNTSGSSKTYTLKFYIDIPNPPARASGWFYDGAQTWSGNPTANSCTYEGISDPSHLDCTFTLANNAGATVNVPFRPGICQQTPITGYAAELWVGAVFSTEIDRNFNAGSTTTSATGCQLSSSASRSDEQRGLSYAERADLYINWASGTFAGTIRFNSGTHQTVYGAYSLPGTPAMSCSVINTHRAECTYASMGNGQTLVMIVNVTNANQAFTEWRNFVVFNNNGKFQTHSEGQVVVP